MITTDDPSLQPANRTRWPAKTWGVTLALALASCGGGNGYSGGMATSAAPTIMFSIQPTTITVGQSATLTWSTTNSGSCTASGSWTGTQPGNGTQAVTPTMAGSTTYTLTCTAPGGGGIYSGGSGGMTSQSVTLMATGMGTAASGYTATNLVADIAGTSALHTDPNLKNPWGIVFGPATPVWVANNGTQTSTLYDGTGKVQPAAMPLVVKLAAGFSPSGIVFNGSATDFAVTSGSNSGAAQFIFSGEGGMIAGWTSAADPANAIVTYTDAAGAVYKGLALANNGTANFLYATDFHNNKIDVFDSKFAKQVPSTTSFTFVDPMLPAGYAPFGIQAINNGTNGAAQLYVAYAVQKAPDNHDNSNGPGLGLIDIYDANGAFVKRLVSPGGALNAPWGLALAPADFGTFKNMLLVGNFGDGKINGYDPSSGAFVGAISDANGTPLVVSGLWGIAFGNDNLSQPHNTLFFAAGINSEADGVYGRIDLGAAPVLNAAPASGMVMPPAH
jgi:uncharacterized protein (TIGR03118 family)